MITYNDVYEAARRERYGEQLQPLEGNFISEVSNYLKEKKELASKEQDDFSDIIIKTKKQIENSMTLFRELMTRRRKKILNLVLISAETGISKQDFNNMLQFEKDLFENLMKCIEVSDGSLNKQLNGDDSVDVKNNLVLFLAPVEEFVDLEGEKMGPYEKGQIINLPREIAKIFLDDGKIEIVE